MPFPSPCFWTVDFYSGVYGCVLLTVPLSFACWGAERKGETNHLQHERGLGDRVMVSWFPLLAGSPFGYILESSGRGKFLLLVRLVPMSPPAQETWSLSFHLNLFPEEKKIRQLNYFKNKTKSPLKFFFFFIFPTSLGPHPYQERFPYINIK